MKFILLIIICSIFNFTSVLAQTPGANCLDAAIITLPTVVGTSVSTGTQSTCGKINDYVPGSYGASGSYGIGEDAVYKIIVPASGGEYTFSLGMVGSINKIFSIHNSCSPALSNCLGGFVTDALINGSRVMTLEAGTYFIFIDSKSPTLCTDFNLTILLSNVLKGGDLCNNALGFCTSTAYEFPNSTAGVAPYGPNYGCLMTVPNPIWYYMEILNSGPIQMNLKQTTLPNGLGANLDVDFDLWGPFTSKASACSSIMSGAALPIQCSFSGLSTETLGIGLPGGMQFGASTPPSAIAGQVYVVLITNYSSLPGYISFVQNGGTGTTDCDPADPCDISNVSTVVGGLDGAGGFQVSGLVTFTQAPATGVLNVTSNGVTQSYPAPFVSPLSYSLSSVPATGLSSTVVASFSASPCNNPSLPFITPTLSSPTIVINSNDSDNRICSGSSVTFTAVITGGGTAPSYQWKLNGVNVGSNASTFITTGLNNNDIVTCVLTSNALNVSPLIVTSSSITTIVNSIVVPSVSITSSDSDNTICSGTSVTFTAVPTNGGTTPIYQWKLNGVNIGSNTTTYSTTGLLNNDVVTCVLTSNSVCASPITATSSAITTIVNAVLVPSVSINSSDSDNTICAGTSVTFTAVATNGGTLPTYQWKLNGVNVGSNTSTYSTTGLLNNDVVTCVLSSNSVCASPLTATSSAITTIVNTVLVPSVSITSSDSDNTICSGTSVIFTAVATNGGTLPSYQWKLNGVNVGSNTSTYSTTGLLNNAVVTCVLTSNSVCASPLIATSSSITTIVNTVLVPSVSITSSDSDNTICSGTGVTFTAIATNGGTLPSYQWKLNGVNVGSNSSTHSSTGLINNDVFTCVLTSNSVCASPLTASSSSLTTIVNAVLVPSVSISSNDADNTICAGSNISFIANVTNGGTLPSYQWKVNGINVGANSTTYSSTGLINSDVITCVVTSSSLCASPLNASSLSIIINVHSIIVPTISIVSSDSDNSICSGSNVVFTAIPTNQGSSPIYQWKLNGVNVGTGSITFSSNNLVNGDVLTCVLTSSSVCAYPLIVESTSIVTTVNELIIPIVSITSSDADNVLCVGDNIEFTALTLNSGTSLIYHWLLNGVNVGTNSNLFSTTALSNDDVVTCVIINNLECVISDTISTNFTGSLTVNDYPVVSSIEGPITVCEGSAITLSNTNTNGLWTSSLTNIAGMNNVGVLSGLNPGVTNVIYSVTENGCEKSVSSNIIVIEKPSEPMLINDLNYCSYSAIPAIEVTSQNSGSFNWYSNSSGLAPIMSGSLFTPSNSIGISTYYVSETVDGCESDLSSINIQIDVCEIEIPTAFTPDNDNINDKWILKGLDVLYPNSNVYIYNKWGNLIFESIKGTYENNSWEGSYKGNPLPVDSYYYIIEYNDDLQKSAKGNVSILLK